MLVEEIVNILFSLIFSHLNLFIHTYIENASNAIQFLDHYLVLPFAER